MAPAMRHEPKSSSSLRRSRLTSSCHLIKLRTQRFPTLKIVLSSKMYIEWINGNWRTFNVVYPTSVCLLLKGHISNIYICQSQFNFNDASIPSHPIRKSITIFNPFGLLYL